MSDEVKTFGSEIVRTAADVKTLGSGEPDRRIVGRVMTPDEVREKGEDWGREQTDALVQDVRLLVKELSTLAEKEYDEEQWEARIINKISDLAHLLKVRIEEY